MSREVDMKKVKKVLKVLKEAKSPAPLGYIARRTGIDNPLELLEKLEEDGMVRRAEILTWSPSMHPMYEVAQPAKEVIEEY